jgi:LmbE family N-acetylglucosaminyl deacetylase
VAATLLFSFAHPDDESFSGAGLACWCQARGIRVVLVCATRGEAGQAGDAAVSGAPADVGAAREVELHHAAAAVGIADVHLLGYRDRELAAADPSAIRYQLVAQLRGYRPAVVATFDPDGFNRHVDHLAISRFTSDAVAAAADPRWFPDLGPPHTVARLLWTPPLGPWDSARSKDLRAEAGADFIIDITPWRDRKIAALRAHRTQHRSIDAHFFNQPDADRILAIEVYRQGFGPPIARRPSADPFEGIDLSVN